ncbi:MAG: hypothetical protein HY291_24210 [Planctomycetes bacterium]|nr:hypothetical protein [Planctomycetota bacterium]
MRSDRELAAQVAAGDRDAALAELLERHGVMLERTIRAASTACPSAPACRS